MVLSPKEIRESLKEANRLVGEIGRVHRRRTVIAARMNEKIQRIKDADEPKLKDLDAEETQLVDKLLDLVLPRYAWLRFGKTKQIKLLNGTISLKRNALAVEVAKEEVEAVIRRIRHAGHTRKLLRPGKYTLDKDAIVKRPDLVAKIKGVSLVRKSTLTIKPSKVDVKPVKRDVDSIKITLPEED